MAGRRIIGGLDAVNGGTATTTTSNGNNNSRPTRSSSAASRRNHEKRVDFHPKLITAQIVSMQCFHYFLLAFLFQLNSVLYNKSVTVDRIFTDQYVRLWHTSGWADVSAILLASLAGYVYGQQSRGLFCFICSYHARVRFCLLAFDSMCVCLFHFFRSVLLAVIVEKSKKCLDFGVTLFLLHLAITTLYGGLPNVLDWWVVHVLGTIQMVLVGEYLCSRRELDDIPLLPL
jgi:protein SYS1